MTADALSAKPRGPATHLEAAPTRCKDVCVRPARRHDLDALAGLWLELMHGHARADMAFALAPEAELTWRRATADMIERKDSFVLLAERHKRAGVLGFCSGWVAKNPPIYALRDVGFLCEMVVCPQHRRRGVGRALMHGARRWFLGRALDEFQLSCASWNEPAQAFWQALGGEPLLLRYRFGLASQVAAARKAPSKGAVCATDSAIV